MRIANVRDRLKLVRGDTVIDVERASEGRFDSAPQAVYARWDEFSAWAASFEGGESEPLDLASVGSPAPEPRQVFGIGLNYREHAAEGGEDTPTFPPTFTKFPTSIAGANDTVELPSDTVDWEVELVVVLSRVTHRVAAADAWLHVAGLTIGQDLSERTVQLRPPIPQFSLGKSYPGFSPMGPVLATPDEFPDPTDLAIECSVGGEVLQSGRTSQMIFPVAELIEALSSVCIMLPGDVIFTGTPSGVGVVRKPQRFLAPGEVLTTRIEGLGEMSNRFVEAPGYIRHRS